MPTNEERREVAARLRKKHSERQGTFEPQSISIQAMNRMDDLLDCLPKRRDMFLDLADLIEPEPERTCRIVGMDCAGNPPYNKSGLHLNSTAAGCSECGYPFNWCRSLIQARTEVVACPNCGAKVVD